MHKVFCLAILLLGPALASRTESDWPFGKRELSTRIKMTRVQYSCSGKDELRLGGVNFQTQVATIHITGTDRTGKPWTLIATTDQCTFWQADLDDDGVADYVFVRAIGTQGLDLLIVLFDDAGRPMPWNIFGHFERDDDGIPELLDVNGDHHAELIVTQWIPCGKSDCWVTDGYQARAGYWHRLTELAGKTLPIGSRGRNTPDYSNVFSDFGQLVRYSPRTNDTCFALRLPEAEGRVDAIDDCHDWVILDNDRACPAAPIVILDRKDGRYIGRSRLLSSAARGAHVRLAARSRIGSGCESIYMWITEP